MKKKLIAKKYQNGGKSEKTRFLKFLDWFSQASLNAAVAGSPSVATAAGWRIDENNNAVQDLQTEEGTKQLQDNLAVISTVPHIVAGGPQVVNVAGKALTNPVVDAGLTIHGATTAPENIKKGVEQIKNDEKLKGYGNLALVGLDLVGAGLLIGKTGKMLALPNFILKYKLGKTYTNNLIKLLGNNKTKEGLIGFRYSYLEPFELYLKDLKVKTNKFSNSDLLFLQELRKLNVLNNLPNERITTIETTSPNVIYYNLYNKDKIGELLTLIDNKNRQHILSIEGKTNKEKNISRDLYDSALLYNNFYNTKGLISGKRLLSPEQTIHIWDKYYPNKEILENTGWHSYDNGLNVKKSGHPIEDYKGKVVDLKTPSSKIPIKSINIFHPDLINTDTWTLKMFDINNLNPYYKQGGTIKFNPFNKFI